MVIATLAFSLFKLQRLLNRSLPIIQEHSEALEIEDSYSLGSENFMMAFSLGQNFDADELEFDSHKVRFTALYRDGLEDLNIFYPLHLCTDTELERFKEFNNFETADRVKRLKKNKNLFCLHSSLSDH